MPNNLDLAIAAMRREMDQYAEERDWPGVDKPFAEIAEIHMRRGYFQLLEHALECMNRGCQQCNEVYAMLKAQKD